MNKNIKHHDKANATAKPVVVAMNPVVGTERPATMIQGRDTTLS